MLKEPQRLQSMQPGEKGEAQWSVHMCMQEPMPLTG